MHFLPWHFGFFRRYRPLPEAEWGRVSEQHPLLQQRIDTEQGLDLLELVLRDSRQEVHRQLAEILWDTESDSEATARFVQLGEQMPPVVSGGAEISTSHG